MRKSLADWVRDADAARQIEEFQVEQRALDFSYVRDRSADYYTALVAELYSRLRDNYEDPADWARLGNALSQFADKDREASLKSNGVSGAEANLYAAAAFYFGGFPASAYIVLKSRDIDIAGQYWNACYHLLSKSLGPNDGPVRSLHGALRRGDYPFIQRFDRELALREEAAFDLGPDEWVQLRLYRSLFNRFSTSNVRAVLPDGYSDFWTPLIHSLLSRPVPNWEFFPSQIEAIRAGILTENQTYSLQMPTGAGKTALAETLIFAQLRSNPSGAAILLVPFRSIAAELKKGLVRNLNGMGVATGCFYGGTVPSGEEVRSLDSIRAVVATPEALSALLSAAPQFLAKVSLVLCDEGHLLDSDSRGVGLEILMSRLKARLGTPPKFVFISAIVPNIEEINSWLNGSPASVVKSNYRPSIAEFSVLMPASNSPNASVSLLMHPHESTEMQFFIQGFLSSVDFRAFSSSLDRFITYPSSSVKVQAIAAARKSLRMGAVAVFAASKRGPQGVAGLAEELIAQLDASIPLPDPIDFANRGEVAAAEEYFRREFGPDWIATRLVARGAVMHHGDIPQETREVVETLVRDGSVHFAICTSTLAEGVNLPIRTLVLYSVQRQRPMLSRDIKNLVGRTGRAGSTTKGLVICANPSQWTLVAPVAKQDPSEAVYGALVDLAKRIVNVLALQNIDLTNQVMERSPVLQSLLDGVDSSLIDLAAEEIGVDELVNMAKRIARQTYASSLTDDATQRVIDTVFELRARRVIELRENGRLHWFQETGARIRMLDSVERILRPKIEAWDQISEATDPKLIEVMVGWAFGHQEVRASLRRAYGLNGKPDVTHLQPTLTKIVGLWLAGRTFHEISNESEVPISVVVSIYSGVISYQLQSLVEQAVAILGKVLDAENIVLSPFVQDFVEYLRLGVPTAKARRYAVAGIRHRRAAVVMGEDDAMPELAVENGESFLVMCLRLLEGTENYYRLEMGNLVYENTVKDIQSYVRRS